METVCLIIGKVLCGLGGGLLCLAIIGAILYIVCCIWIDLSNKFRGICKAESLIFEYKKYRNDFMYWKNMKEEREKGHDD